MIIYFAPGGGLGKATRAAAICRYLDDVEVVRVGTETRPLDYRQIPYRLFGSRVEAINYINASDASLVVLDEDPRGDTPITKPKLLTYRLGRPSASYYISYEKGLGGGAQCWPIISLDDSEILSREDARDDLGISQTEHLIMAIGSASAPGVVAARWPDAYVLREWPAMRWLQAADLIVGAAGYNLWHEVDYLGLTAEWVAVMSDQRLRINQNFHVPPRINAAAMAASLIRSVG